MKYEQNKNRVIEPKEVGMKEYITAFVMTQSMFCALPFPCRAWKEEARNKMLLFLPVVGLEIGVLWVLLDRILSYFQIPDLIYGLAMCALPYLATGLIHLDGFLDVTDAICSWRNLEQRRTILKDSHVGSFAVVWCVFLLLAGFAAFSSAPETGNIWCLLLIPVVSRCCSALAVMNLKPMHTSQYAIAQKYPRWHSVLLAVLSLGCVILSFGFWGKVGLVLLGEMLAYAYALWRSYRSLDGMNGDISGFCLTIAELCAVALWVLL